MEFLFIYSLQGWLLQVTHTKHNIQNHVRDISDSKELCRFKPQTIHTNTLKLEVFLDKR